MDTDCAARIGGAAAAVACGMWRVPFVEIALNPAKRCRKYNYGRLDHNTIFPPSSLSDSQAKNANQWGLNCNRHSAQASATRASF